MTFWVEELPLGNFHVVARIGGDGQASLRRINLWENLLRCARYVKHVVPNHQVNNAHQALRRNVIPVLRVPLALAIPLVNHRNEPADVQVMLDRLFILGGLFAEDFASHEPAFQMLLTERRLTVIRTQSRCLVVVVKLRRAVFLKNLQLLTQNIDLLLQVRNVTLVRMNGKLPRPTDGGENFVENPLLELFGFGQV